MSLNWIFFPKTLQVDDNLLNVISVFDKNSKIINSYDNDDNETRKHSNEVLNIIAEDLRKIGYKVESGKKKKEKIGVPVLFGEMGKAQLQFQVDAYNFSEKTVIEVEAGRAFSNHQFLKDIFETSMMVNVDYLVLAVRNVYNKNKDYEKILTWLDTLYLTERIKLDLKGILLIGY